MILRPAPSFVLAGEEGHDWCLAAGKVAAAKDLPIDAVCVGHTAGDLYDPRSAWTRLRGHGASGAILVRPDRFVGWRATALRPDPAAALSDAVDRMLAR